MPAFQAHAISGAQIPLFPRLKSGLAQKPILRARQRPFRIAEGAGPYRLPKPISDRLERELAAFRNAEAAFVLAVFLGRFWSAPNRLGMPFPIDRRALANHQALGLPEAQIRGAIQTLERVGFLERRISGKGSRYRPTTEGLHRKPILFEFGGDFSGAFRSANQMAKRKSEHETSKSPFRRPLSTCAAKPPVFKSPKNKIALERELLTGQLADKNREDETALEKSLASLGRALGVPVCRD